MTYFMYGLIRQALHLVHQINDCFHSLQTKK